MQLLLIGVGLPAFRFPNSRQMPHRFFPSRVLRGGNDLCQCRLRDEAHTLVRPNLPENLYAFKNPLVRIAAQCA